MGLSDTPSPTIPQRRRFDSIAWLGCVACLLDYRFNEPCQIHHGLKSGRRPNGQAAHWYTVGLCPWHHQGIANRDIPVGKCREIFGPSLAKEKKAFIERYGTDSELVALQNKLLARDEAEWYLVVREYLRGR